MPSLGVRSPCFLVYKESEKYFFKILLDFSFFLFNFIMQLFSAEATMFLFFKKNPPVKTWKTSLKSC